jgi:hypothetical protein
MVGLFKHPKRQIKKLLRDGEYDEAIAFGIILLPPIIPLRIL